MRAPSILALAVLPTLACEGPADILEDLEGIARVPSGRCEDAPPRGDPSCETDPVLCGAPFSVVFTGGAPRLRIAFVPEGYDEAHLASFERRARALAEELVSDHEGVVGRRPDHVEILTVRAPSETDEVVDGDRDDTLLAGCVMDDWGGGQEPLLEIDEARARLLVQESVGEVDVVIVLLRTSHGRANARYAPRTATTLDERPDRPWVFADDYEATHVSVNGPSMALLNAFSDVRTLDHELGHALVGLDDEYSDIDACMQPFFDVSSEPGGLPGVPNLTLSPVGEKWADLVDGADEGGSRLSRCVYHPPGSCRMQTSDADAYCPVCARAIDRMHRALDDEQAGSPVCALSASSTTLHPYRTGNDVVEVLVRDEDAPTQAFVVIDDVVVHGVVGHGRGTATSFLSIPAARTFADDLTVRVYCEDGRGGLADASLVLPRRDGLW